MYVYPSAGGRVKWLHRSTLWCAFSRKTLWNCHIFARVCFLIYDILEYVYHSACDKKFSVQLDPYLVQRKYTFRIYVSEIITTQSSSPYWPMPCEVRRNHCRSSTSIDTSCTHGSTISNITCFEQAIFVLLLEAWAPPGGWSLVYYREPIAEPLLWEFEP